VVDRFRFLAAEGDGVRWTLLSRAFNDNLVGLGCGRSKGEHVTDAVDVVVVVLAGFGQLMMDGVGLRLAPAVVAQIPKDAPAASVPIPKRRTIPSFAGGETLWPSAPFDAMTTEGARSG
jgi:hypothetical protein